MQGHHRLIANPGIIFDFYNRIARRNHRFDNIIDFRSRDLLFIKREIIFMVRSNKGYNGVSEGIGRNIRLSAHYHIADAELDQLILEGRASDDQAYRKTVYKAALDKIIDWAVEIPVYQRQNCIIFSAERINMDTVLGDITTFYGWLNGVDTMEMAK